MFRINFNFGLGNQHQMQGPSQMQGHSQTQNSMPPQGMNPDDYAIQYASENGLSVEEAKAELKSKYGDPSPVGMADGSIFGSQNLGFNNSYNDYFSNEDMQEFLHLQQMLFPHGNMNNQNPPMPDIAQEINPENITSPFLNPHTGTVTGPQQEGDPQFNFFNNSENNNLINEDNGRQPVAQEPNRESEENNNHSQEGGVESVAEIREILSNHEFNQFMQDSGFNDRTPEEEIVEFFNKMNINHEK